jgi:hypothetical protein
MIRIEISHGERIAEHRGGFLKRHPMLGQISPCLGFVPFKTPSLISYDGIGNASTSPATRRGEH